jgi:hypothetical protein
MPGFLLHVNAILKCPHAKDAVVPPMQPRVLLSGMPAAPLSTVIAVLPGCPFQIPVGAGTKPQPCITIKWFMPAARVFIMGQPVAVVPPPGPGPGPGVSLSIEQIPAGPPMVGFVQPRVKAL